MFEDEDDIEMMPAGITDTFRVTRRDVSAGQGGGA